MTDPTIKIKTAYLWNNLHQIRTWSKDWKQNKLFKYLKASKPKGLNSIANIGPSSSWSYGSLIYCYLFNQRLSPLTLWVRIPLWRGVLDTTLFKNKFVSDLRQVGSLHRVLKYCFKVALSTITPYNNNRKCLILHTT